MITDDLKKLAVKQGTPLLVIDHSVIRKNYETFRKFMPRVEPFYAMKANPVPEILKTLYKLGAGFDVASLGEFNVLSNVLEGNKKKKTDFIYDKVIYANPVKPIEYLEKLKEYNLLMTFDNSVELDKIAKHYKNARLVLRVDVPNVGAIVELSSKFGAKKDICINLIKQADKLGLNIVGLSFHVGSQCTNYENYQRAFEISNDIIKQAKELGHDLQFLDIGGGWPAPYDSNVIPFENFAKVINEQIEKYYKSSNIRIIAEPGRFMVATSTTFVGEIIGKGFRMEKPFYYLNDGVYGTFSGAIFDHIQYHFKSFKEGKLIESAIAGPTCDALDKISTNDLLPDLQIGDLLYAENAGAYTNASASSFNGFPLAKIVNINI
jgi:ornithine decarboxylase